MYKLCFLHGFLGCKEDWNSILAEIPKGIALEYPFKIPPDAVLVGYSMGGRIALRYPNPKVIIAAHLGLTEGHAERKKDEQKWIDLIQTVPFSDFLHAWYAQPLFNSLRAHPDFPEIFARRLKQDPRIALQQLLQHRLSEQPRITPVNAFFLYGEKDLKYKNLYTHLNATPISRSGHACHLENPKECAKHIKDFMGRVGNLHRHQIP